VRLAEGGITQPFQMEFLTGAKESLENGTRVTLEETVSGIV
jgi:hypothetical protein